MIRFIPIRVKDLLTTPTATFSVSKIFLFILCISMTFAAGGREFNGNTIFGHVVNLPDVAIYNIEFMGLNLSTIYV